MPFKLLLNPRNKSNTILLEFCSCTQRTPIKYVCIVQKPILFKLVYPKAFWMIGLVSSRTID